MLVSTINGLPQIPVFLGVRRPMRRKKFKSYVLRPKALLLRARKKKTLFTEKLMLKRKNVKQAESLNSCKQ